MSQGPPSGYPPPPGGPAPAAAIPWDRRQELGIVTALVETTKEVLTGPSDFFRRMPVAGGIGSPLLYAVVIGYLGLLLSAVYSAVFLLVRGAAGAAALGPLSDRPELAAFVAALQGWGGIIGQVVFGPIGIVIGVFIWTAIIHLMLLLLDGAGQGFEATFRVLSYSHAASVLAIVPLCGGPIAGLWSLVLWIIGLAQAQRIPAWKAAAAVFLPIVLCCCCCAVGMGTMFGGLASIIHRAR
jgi:hypothetical protein